MWPLAGALESVVLVAGAGAEFAGGAFWATPVASIAMDSAPAAEITLSRFQFITLTSFPFHFLAIVETRRGKRVSCEFHLATRKGGA